MVVAPAMNTAMWEHPVTWGQVKTLESWGVEVLWPVEKVQTHALQLHDHGSSNEDSHVGAPWLRLADRMITSEDQGMEARWPFDKKGTHASQMKDECVICEYCHVGAPLCVDDSRMIIASAMNLYYREISHLANGSKLFSEKQSIFTPRCSADRFEVM